jgi:hypothetical protein
LCGEVQPRRLAAARLILQASTLMAGGYGNRSAMWARKTDVARRPQALYRISLAQKKPTTALRWQTGGARVWNLKFFKILAWGATIYRGSWLMISCACETISKPSSLQFDPDPMKICWFRLGELLPLLRFFGDSSKKMSLEQLSCGK